jgi:hypothetical protein
MSSIRYIALKQKHVATAKSLLTFCASAKDIRKWAGVPTKTSQFSGFQRALTKKWSKIAKYFNEKELSPTSVVVAFRQDALTVDPLSYPSSWSDDSLTTKPDFVTISFSCEEIDEENADVLDLAARVVTILKDRVPADEQVDEDESDSSTETAEEEAEEDSEEGTTAEESSEAEEAESEESERADGGQGDAEESQVELDVGQSRLRKFYNLLRDTERLKHWIEKGSGESGEDSDEKQQHRTSALKQSLIGLLRPAMLVDGQHRVEGAYRSDYPELTFAVCAIPDADWVEQVFQFVILNKTAKPLSSAFQNDILNTSLTNIELGEIEDRFDRIGIRNTDRRLMAAINHNADSPFYQMVKEPSEIAGTTSADKLSDKGMLRIAKRWYHIHNKDGELAMFKKIIGRGVSAANCKKRWKESPHDVWRTCFYEFWKVMHDRYKPEGVWERGGNYRLLYIVTLQTVQDMFLEIKSDADTVFGNLDDFRNQVRVFFEKVPGAYFTGWKATGLQSGNRDKWIKNDIKRLRKGDKLKDVTDESPLYKEASVTE